MPSHPFIQKLKKHRGAILGTAIVLGITIPVIVSTVQAKKYSLIFSVGSSAVKPILDSLSQSFKQQKNDTFDLIVDAGGSATGIQAVANGNTNVGNCSREPSQNEAGVNGIYHNEWIQRNLKTVTIGWDSIGIIYKAPKEYELDITKDNIAKLYEAMTGWYTDENAKNYTLNDLITTPQNAFNTPITAYSRSGGANKSGTADAFAHDSHLIDINTLPPKTQEALINGQYNAKRNIQTTNESNIETWRRVEDDKKDGAITYLSTAFILQNIERIEAAGFRVATYNGHKIDKDLNTVANGYNWVRPINCIFSLNWKSKTAQSFKDFLIWILYDELGKTTLLKNFIKPLSDTEKQQLALPATVANDEEAHQIDWKSDYAIDSSGQRFGAQIKKD